MPRIGNMLYLVSYDIPASPEGDRRRGRLARYLQGVGLRVQWSVFEMDISPHRLRSVCAEIEKRIDDAEDSVRIYPLCGTCSSRTLRLGKESAIEDSGVWVW